MATGFITNLQHLISHLQWLVSINKKSIDNLPMPISALATKVSFLLMKKDYSIV